MRVSAISLVGVVVFAATAGGCKKKEPPALPKLVEQVPKVADAARVLGADVPVPRYLVILAADGSLAAADAPPGPDGWTVLTAKAPKNAGVPVDKQSLGTLLGEAAALGQSISQTKKAQAAAGPLAVNEDLAPPPPGDDDPPPPEPEEEEEEEETGGTGTAMALDEGKMGKKDSDRVEGQYKMKRNNDDPALARQQAIEAAKNAGIIGTIGAEDSAFADITGTDRGGFGFGRRVPDPELPARMIEVVGAAPGEGDGPARALIIAAPTAKASALVDTIDAAGPSLIAVSHQGALRALRIGFDLERRFDGGFEAPPETWLELRIGADGIVVEAVPGPAVTVPWASGGVDAAGLKKAFDEAGTWLPESTRRDVDVLVAADTDVQRVVDVVAALDAAGARVIGIGDAPAAGSPELGKRGKRIVRARMGQPSAVGDLDKAIIRRYIKRKLPAVKACYEQALATNPELSGTVQTQFFIAPNGTVADAKAAGVDPALADCVAAIIKAIEFPKPKGGGGVQVNYPFTFTH